MFSEFQNMNLFPTTGADILINLFVALMCGLFITWLYRHTYKGPGFSVSFVNSIILLALITSVMMMVIGNNLARAFGLVGAMSIIRFRTAVKDTQDIVFIFFGLCAGMAAGVGYHRIAILGTLFIGLIIYILSKTNIIAPNQEEYLLQFSYCSNGEEIPTYLSVMKKFCKKHKVINVKSIDEQNMLELSYYVRFKNKEKNSGFIKELQNVEGIKQINLYFDEERF
jgi:uncharacterized membrane protein YhiD involved in acid resistance